MAEELQKSLAMVDGFIRNQTPYLQGSIVHADSKANFLLALAVVLLGYLESTQPFVARIEVAGALSGWDSVLAGLSLTAALLLVLSGCYAVWVVYPRYDPPVTLASSSFFAISRYPGADDFVAEMLHCGDEAVISRQLRTHHYRCQVCARKWTAATTAYRFIIAGFSVFAVHFILAAVLRISR